MVPSKSEIQQLVESSYMYVQVNTDLIQRANIAFEKLIAFLIAEEITLTYIRRGEEDADLGLISREISHGGDVKHFFHWSHDLFFKFDAAMKEKLLSMRPEIEAIQACYLHINAVALSIGTALQKYRGDVFGNDLECNMRRATNSSSPYANNTLRALLYPPVAEQKGAHPHDDRGFLAIHLHSQNGELVGFKPDGEMILLRPPEGYAVAFFGAKAEIMTNGYVKSFRHGSLVKSGEERRAMVQFIHADIGMEVRTAEDALREFRS